ncbi:tRNA 5-methylaminomethyl-2-thiouridylate-methyltransferase [Pyrrhoderma noxium]|uniref:tRNA-5-taurinomethyluridine 2-sulfurtransferase n=1 Tax=Pyrrhoderma noxium TaxID=2282107 RepID=A0A286UWS4_9AGAM|nr:tRNA 5-methylaminomethyl-2-thiouridylate-methyltransferase [Pyrrhoderma noxium]
MFPTTRISKYIGGACYKRRLTRYLSTSNNAPESVHDGPRKGSRVVVGMSGGVDSSVTARLLAEKDYDLSAVYMRNWDTRDETGTDKGCEWEKDWEDVQRVCRQLDIPHKLIDLSKEYWNNVFEPSLRLWEAGQTPNPDVMCNREVKFGALVNCLSDLFQYEWFATGHYSGVEWTDRLSWSNQIRRRPKLVRALDKTKDQSYYLSSITETSLSKTIFPLHHLKKTQVRELAKKYDLPTANREESMGICFVGEKRRFEDFLLQYLPPKPGSIIELRTGKILGTHQGLWRYTIGQGAKLSGLKERMFVAKKCSDKNELYLVPGSIAPELYFPNLVADLKWMYEDDEPPVGNEGYRARVQIRYRSEDVPCTIFKRQLFGRDRYVIQFDSPQHAVAPGQVAAVYDTEGIWCIGSGVIESVQQ